MGAGPASQANRLGVVLAVSLDTHRDNFFPLFALHMNSLSSVPDDVLALVLCRLDLADFCAAAGTCHTLHGAARKKTAWPKAVSCINLTRSTCVASEQRSLSATLWAGCNSIVLLHAYDLVEAHSWLERLCIELVHVVSLSLECCNIIGRSMPVLSESCRAWLDRLVSLRTNIWTLVHATSRKRLTSLTIASHKCTDDWMNLIPTLASVKYVHIESTHDVRWVSALAKLANLHHTLRSIRFPDYAYECDLTDLLNRLLNNSNTMDLSSIRELVNVPASMDELHRSLQHLPWLSVYAMSTMRNSYSYKEISCSNGLVSLFIDTRCSNIDTSSLHPYLTSLTELSIVGKIHGILSPLPRLRHLQLPLKFVIDNDIASCAPYVEQFSIYMSAWNYSHLNRNVLPCFASLSRMPALRHVRLLCSYESTYERVAPAIVTHALITGMLASSSWRHVTSHMMPAPIRVHDVDTALLTYMQWHVVQNSKHISTYRPRMMQLARWRAWVPGLQAKQITWDLCLCV
jgi:hypothetical protein